MQIHLWPLRRYGTMQRKLAAAEVVTEEENVTQALMACM
jgi:hypothetical protein